MKMIGIMEFEYGLGKGIGETIGYASAAPIFLSIRGSVFELRSLGNPRLDKNGAPRVGGMGVFKSFFYLNIFE